MVARFCFGRSVASSLRYNEQKVVLGKAGCIGGYNLLKDVDQLDHWGKLWHFKRLTKLNERTRCNALHVSLNFLPTEILSDKKMKSVARDFMVKIGFAAQPCIVYRHYDAAHPHLHIVSTNIQYNGRRIYSHALFGAGLQSLCKEIEEKYGLAHACRQDLQTAYYRGLDAPRKMQYGKNEMIFAMSNVIENVIKNYCFDSLNAFNAVLNLYNVMADSGAEGSRLRMHKGLLYRALDQQGKRVGVPIKASAFRCMPTLKNLENKFLSDRLIIPSKTQRLQAALCWTLARGHTDIAAVSRELEKDRISIIHKAGPASLRHDLYFVDHKCKLVACWEDLRCSRPNAVLNQMVEEFQLILGNQDARSYRQQIAGQTDQQVEHLLSNMQIKALEKAQNSPAGPIQSVIHRKRQQLF